MGQQKNSHRLVFSMLSSVLAVLACLSFWYNLANAEPGVPYDVVLEGVTEKELVADLQTISETFSLKDKPPVTMGILRHRAEYDADRFLQVLKAQGYYGAKVEFTIDEQKQPALLTFHVASGPLYRFHKVDIELEGEADKATFQLPRPEELGLKNTDPATAQAIIDGQENLLRAFRNAGYPFARTADRRVVVDHRINGVLVTIRVDSGPIAKFGVTKLTGLQSVNEDFVRGKIPWSEGDRYDSTLLSTFRKRLTDTGLFALVTITPANELTPDGLLPVSVELKERKHRTIRAGLSYQTDEGFGGKISWENRNVFHNGERLKTGVTASEIVLALEGLFEKPAFLHEDQSLLVNFRLADEDTDAYTSRSIESSIGIERRLSKTMRIGAGPAFRAAKVDQLNKKEDFTLLSLPGHFEWDYSNSLLDPTRGGRLNLQVIPYVDAMDTSLSFVKNLISYRHYFELLESPFVVFAGRAAFGSIAGAGLASLPADIRLYSGGGGSVRGYAYQTIGPLLDNDPVGGRSLLELSAELRFKVTEAIGFVTFLDGGTVYEAVYPDFNESMRWGAGTGLRYYTPIGPLRVDVAVPLNRRPDVDDPFQVYLSIGQAF